MSSYRRVTGVTDTYVTMTALPSKSSKICAHSVAIAQKNDHLESFLKWFKSQKPQLNLTKLAEVENLQHLGRKDHIKRLQQRRVQSISETASLG